jgi:hypothetical protein
MAQQVWFTSDTHFGHTNVIKYSGRPFADVNEMNEKLVLNWNAIVKPGDVVYHLGDFALCDAERATAQLRQRQRLLRGFALEVTDRERAALQYVEEATQTKRASDDTFAALRAHFDDRQIVAITGVELTTEAEVPGIDQAKFQELAEAAKKGCPVSRALAGTNITLKATLVSAAP